MQIKKLTEGYQAIKGTEQALLKKLQHLNQAALQDFHIAQDSLLKTRLLSL